MSTVIRFGTDGWRAIIAEDYTFDNVRRCTQAVVDQLRSVGMAERGIVVGYDTRFASEDFASAAAEVIAGNGFRCYLCDKATPTPVISFSILKQGAGGGITITASHNPAVYNGFKVRSHYGGAAAPETIAEIERRLDRIDISHVKRLSVEKGKEAGLVRVFDPAPDYIAHLSSIVDFDRIRRADIKVVQDAMYGTGAGWFPRLLEGGNIRVQEIDAERNPSFPGISPEPIPRNLQKLFRVTRETGADVGLATDGDADRLGVCDEHGDFIDQLRVYSLLVLYALEVRGWRGPIVKTVSTSSMIDRLGQIYGVPVYETAVGFKYVAPKMLETDAVIGGEESGGYAFRGHIPERDGILAGLYILDMMVQLDCKPSQLVEYLFSKVGPHYYGRVDTAFPAERREEMLKRMRTEVPSTVAGVGVVTVNTLDGFKYVLSDGSWLLIRFSGTEPIMRIYAEAPSPERVEAILQSGRAVAGLA